MIETDMELEQAPHPRRFPYTLKLLKHERDAIDFVGYRYENGNDFYKLLCRATWEPVEADWDHDCEIVFRIPETLAWDIDGLLGDSTFPMFGDILVSKIVEFLGKIV